VCKVRGGGEPEAVWAVSGWRGLGRREPEAVVGREQMALAWAAWARGRRGP